MDIRIHRADQERAAGLGDKHRGCSTSTQARAPRMTEKFSSEAPGIKGKKQTRIILIDL